MAYHTTVGSQIFDIATLAIKDSLRGFRHISLYVRSVWVRAIVYFPSFLKKPSKSLVRRVDHLAEHVERTTANVVHQYLDPDITRDSEMATFSKIIIKDDAPRLFAKTTYDNLKLANTYLGPRVAPSEAFFISEMLSACAFRKARIRVDAVGEESTNAALVLVQLLNQGVLRTSRSVNAYRSSRKDIRKFAEVTCFAHMLWLLIARDYEPEREHHLLHACCDLSLVIHEQINEAGGDIDKLAKLLSIHARMV